MAVEFTVSDVIPATPEMIYTAWLDSETHEKMTGGGATASDEIGGSFSAWDGYISGENVALKANASIVQTWRTTEFKEEELDSNLEITLTPVDKSTEIPLTHTGLPEHGMQYRQGWVDHYFTPMKAYFSQ